MIDFNLLRVFCVIYENGSIKAASHKIGVTPSAISHSLQKLRAHFGDPIFIKTAKGVEPTMFESKLYHDIKTPIESLVLSSRNRIYGPDGFPKEFVVAVETLDTIGALDNILDMIIQDQDASIKVVAARAVDIYDDLASGEYSIAIGNFQDAPDSFYVRGFSDETYLCVMRSDHPLLNKMTAEDFLQCHHLAIHVDGGSKDHFDDALESIGQTRRIRLILPNGFGAMLALRRTDLVAVVSRSVATHLVTNGYLAACSLPFEVPPRNFKIMWHRRFHHDAGHKWLRERLAKQYLPQ